MSDLDKYLKKQLKDEKFKKEFEKTEKSYELTKKIIAARISCDMTQEQLSKKTGISQSNISRIESGTYSPTYSTLQTLAKGMGKELKIEFK